MRSTLVTLILSLSTALALPGPRRAPQHHHHVKRDDEVVYATVQVTQYITMTAGQSDSSVAQPIMQTDMHYGNVALAQASATSSSAPSTMSTSTKSPAATTTSVPSSSSASTASSAATTTSATASATSNSGSKRGLAWPSDNPSSMKGLFSSNSLSWYFNWGTTATSGLSQTFIYEQWGSDNMDNVSKLPTGSTLIGFNEPDGSNQAMMTAAQAAAYYKASFTPLRKTGQIASLGTPSITNGASGITWLTEFMAACSDCEIDFVSAHWYGPSMTLLESQMTAIHTAFGLPVWITEMACTEWSASSNPSSDEIATFLEEAMTWMDAQTWIARYAWFGAMSITDTALGTGNMLVTSDGTTLSALGKQYLTL